jgi:hypothetical protein
LSRWGENVDVFWAYDGRGLIILVRAVSLNWKSAELIQTTTSHLLFYQLQPTSSPAYAQPSSSTFPPISGPGEGDILLGWTIRALGTAFLMGGCTSVHPQAHSLIITLKHPPSILTVSFPVDQSLLSPAGSHFPPKPLDGEVGEGDIWDMHTSKEWMVWPHGEYSDWL